jgi:hypothetical protein
MAGSFFVELCREKLVGGLLAAVVRWGSETL